MLTPEHPRDDRAGSRFDSRSWLALFGDGSRPIGVERILTAVIIFLVSALVFASNRSIALSHPGTLDPWCYFGLFRRPAVLSQLFPGTYYASRLSFILPGFLLHQILPPLAASYVFHLLVWLGAVAALYSTLKYLVNYRTALLSAVVFGFYPSLWAATGWDYPDGAGIAYYLLTIAFLTAAARDPQPRRLLVAAAGAVGAADFYVNMVWLLFIPFLPVLWIGVRKIWGHALALPRVLLWATAGAAGCTIVLVFVSHFMGGPYPFYWPSIQFAVGQVGAPNPWKAKGWAWMWNASWLLLSAIAAGTGLVTTLRDLRRPISTQTRLSLLLYANLLFCAGAFLFGEFLGMGFLETSYYASCLIPSVFLFLGARFWAVSPGIRARDYAALLAWAVVLLSLVWWNHSGSVWAHAARFGTRLPWLVAVAALMMAASRRHSAPRMAVILGGLALVVFAQRGAGNAPDTSTAVENSFHRITESGDYCERYRQGRRIWFWYGPDQANEEFVSINSQYFYQPSQFGLDFPKVPEKFPNLTDSVLAVLSSRADAVAAAESALQAARLKNEFLGRETVTRDGLGYTLAFFHLDMIGPLTNGDFESGTYLWERKRARLSTEDGGQSGKCLVMAARSGPAQYAMERDVLRLKPNGHYRFGFWVQSGSSGDEPFEAGLWDVRTSRWIAVRSGRSTTTWTPYTIEIQNPPSILLSVKLQKNSGTKGSLRFDSVTIADEESSR